MRTLAWQKTAAAYNGEGEQEEVHSRAMGLRGHQRPISLKELKRRKETHQAGDAGGSVAKLKEDADAEAPDKNKWGRDESSAAVETFNSDVRSLDKVTPLSGPKDKPALRYRQASSTRLVTRTDSIESSSGNPVVDLAADSQIHEDISTKGLQTEMPLTVQGRGISDPATEVAGKPGPRFLTVEDFLRREAEKKREEGVGDLDNNALVALKSIGTSSLAPNRDERPKRRSQRAVQSGPHWKILYKEEDVDESQEADPAEMEDAKEKALSLLNRR